MGTRLINVSVIIPALNEAENIARSIRSAQDAGAFEVIVADGGSEDETVTIAKSLDCKVIISERGRGIQQNAGAREATGDVFLFLHADNYLDIGCIDQIKYAVENKGAKWGCFKQRIEAKGFKYRLLEWGNAFRAKWLKMVYGDQGIFVIHDLFTNIGGFENSVFMEDVGIANKLRKFCRPRFSRGVIFISARRWEKNGVIRQTLQNWRLVILFQVGMPAERLAPMYDKTRIDI